MNLIELENKFIQLKNEGKSLEEIEKLIPEVSREQLEEWNKFFEEKRKELGKKEEAEGHIKYTILERNPEFESLPNRYRTTYKLLFQVDFLNRVKFDFFSKEFPNNLDLDKQRKKHFSFLDKDILYRAKLINKDLFYPSIEYDLKEEFRQNEEYIKQTRGAFEFWLKFFYYREYIHNNKIHLQPILEKLHLQNSLKNTLFTIKIKDFQCIKDLEIQDIPLDSQWIFFTGENGDGKTSLLQAIALGILGNQDDEAKSILSFLQKDKEEFISNIGIEFLQNGAKQLNHFNWTETRKWDLIRRNATLPPAKLLAYGVRRLDIQSEASKNEVLKYYNAYTLLNDTQGGGNLQNIETWLKDEILENTLESPKIKLVLKVLQKVLPSISEIKIEGKHIYYIEKGFKASMHQLSSGNKSLLAFVGDILIRLLAFEPETTDFKDFSAIILIDELDLHLHPKWQKELPWRLSEIFPKVQFVATTHSVVPLMGSPEKSVFYRITRDENEGTKAEKLDLDIKNLSANLLLNSPLFDLSLVSKQLEPEDSKASYRTEENYQEYLVQQALDKRLQSAKDDILKNFFEEEE